MPSHDAADLTVLYIEDDRLNVVLMEEVFRDLPQWTLLVAETGAEALLAVSASRPQLILMDMNLPDMDGMALLKLLQQAHAHTLPPCIALSADDLTEQVSAAKAAGFTDYWLKPIDVPQLHAALRARLSSTFNGPSLT